LNERLFQISNKHSGFDEITGGGLPKGRPTLVCGGQAVVKLFLQWSFSFAVATLYDEPGVFISFEETEKELTAKRGFSGI